MTVAAYTGTFDPIHRGHLEVIEAASAMFDEVIVVVLGNPRKPTGLLDVATRRRLIDASTSHLPNVRSIDHDGLAVDGARVAGAPIIIRSFHKERGNELVMAATNDALAAVGTGFVPTDAGTGWISSTVVRTLLGSGRVEEACAIVPPPVADWLRRAS